MLFKGTHSDIDDGGEVIGDSRVRDHNTKMRDALRFESLNRVGKVCLGFAVDLHDEEAARRTFGKEEIALMLEVVRSCVAATMAEFLSAT